MKSNFVIFLSDEEAAPFPYESEEIKMWRKMNLPMYSFFEEKTAEEGCLNMENHRINNSGCRPSRADIQTGVNCNKHKVFTTDGLALTEKDVNYIDPNKTKTLGIYLRENGYNTHYIGKQHYKYIPDGSNINLETHGWSDWKGPEPHGPSNLEKTSGYYRDKEYVQETLNLLPKLQEPFCLFISLLNPHDIVFWTAHEMQYYPVGNFLAKIFGIPYIGPEVDESLPQIIKFPTDEEDLSLKPSAQEQFREVYKKIISKPFYNLFHSDKNRLRRFYFTLIKDVQQNFFTIFSELKKYNFHKNTFYLYTADHGELLGNHGGLYQKWYNMYEEAIRVPFYLYHPNMSFSPIHKNILTCHLDIVPTILGLANIKINKIFDGKNLAPYILGKRTWNILSVRRLNFYCYDDVTNGDDDFPIVVKRTKIFHWLRMFRYKGVKGPRHIRAQIKATGDGIFKYAKYTNPDNSKEYEEEIYNLSSDPYEQKNLTTIPEVFKNLKKTLFKRNNRKNIIKKHN